LQDVVSSKEKKKEFDKFFDCEKEQGIALDVTVCTTG
jgi:hypothetical protein